jgi:hypothetical protein
MRIEELIVMQSDGVMRLSFHPRLTVLTELDGMDRDALVDVLHKSMLGGVDHAELRYRDMLGRQFVIRRSGGRRRIAITDRAGADDVVAPGSADLPRITHVTPSELGADRLSGTLSGDEPPSLPQLVERLIGWLGRARNAGSRGTPSLAVLNEPLGGLGSRQIWDLLDAVERLSNMVQVVYLTADPTVATWAAHRSAAGALQLITAQAIHA